MSVRLLTPTGRWPGDADPDAPTAAIPAIGPDEPQGGRRPPVIELLGVSVSYKGQRRSEQRHRSGRRRPGHHENGQHDNGQHSSGRHGNGQHGSGHHDNGQHSSGRHGNGQHSARHQYQLRPPALAPVDLTVWRGELITLTGQGRAGLSTLLHVIGLLDRPTTGTYLLNGIDTAKLGERNRAALRGREIGFVFQRLNLVASRSAADNVALPLLYAGMRRRQRREAALHMLDRVGIAALANLIAGQLSASERQLVAIARALVIRPSLLLCDDPTSNLDADSGAQVVGLLAGLHREGMTVLIATRDHVAAAYSSRSITIGAGSYGQQADPGS